MRRKKLKTSEERLKILFEFAPDAYYLSDLKGNFIDGNKVAEEISGYKKEELIGKNLLELGLLPPMQIPKAASLLARNNLRQPTGPDEFILNRKDGKQVALEIRTFPVKIKNQALVLGIARDVTERKHAAEAMQRAHEELELRVKERTAELRKADEILKQQITARKLAAETLKKSELKYRTLIERMNEGLLHVDNNDEIKFVNNRFCDMVGYSRKELLGKVASELLLNEEDHRFMKERIGIHTQNISDQYEIEMKKKSGETIWTQISGAPVIEADGKVSGSIGIHTDITERKRAEKALKESEKRFRDLFDNAPGMYIILSPNGIIIDFNQRGLKQLGYEKKEILGKSIINFIHPGDFEKARMVMTHIQKTGKPPKSIEVRLIQRNGHDIWVSKEFSLLKADDATLQAIRVVCRNITERKRLQDELARAQRLESAGRVAGQIAHDLNNLLAPLTAYPTLIREELPADHPVLDMLDEMQSAAKKIAEINQQLLALGRRGHYTMEPIDLNDLIQKVILSQNFPNELVVHQEFASHLFLINGGAAQLTRALTNLLNNAKEAMQGMGVLTIKTKNVYLDKPLKGYQSVKRGEFAKLEISDAGTGIEPEILDKIFDPFFTTKKMDRMRGSGLGLSIVHGILEDHKGYITVDSSPGQGTTFCLFIPVTRRIESEVTKFIEATKGGNERILIVDDDPVQRKVAGQILQHLGYIVHAVSSGEKAINYVKSHAQDLLVLDMVMDGIDGAETYRRILEFQPEQKAIILSGYAMSQRVQEALRLGAGTFIAKPVTLNALVTAVRNELDKRKIAPLESDK